MSKADELLRGGIDMHCHAYPEFSLEAPNRFSNEDTVRMMREAGMGGVIFKSHIWPTISAAAALNALYEDFSVFGSITLNASSGGVCLWALESASKQGAKVAYMPTWSARNDLAVGGINKHIERYLPTLSTFPREEGFSPLDTDGKVTAVTRDVLAFMRDRDMVLFTGHLSPNESIAIARAAKDIGFGKLVFNHPDSGSVKADFDQIVTMAELGGYVEICALGLTPLYYRITPQKFKEIIHRIGAERCVLSTDYFFEWSPPASEQMRLLIGSLLEVGVGEDEVRTMVRDNPRLLLGMGY